MNNQFYTSILELLLLTTVFGLCIFIGYISDAYMAVLVTFIVAGTIWLYWGEDERK